MVTISNTAAVVNSLEETPSSITRDRIVAFMNDDMSAAALRTGLEGSKLEIKRGTIRQATKMLETDTEVFAIVADITGIDDPIGALEDLARVCPPDVMVALVGESTDMAFYRKIVNEMGASEYLAKPLTRDSVQLILRPKFMGDTGEAIDRGGHVVTVCGAQGGAGATSIAVNLALRLAEVTKAKVAILDLHLQGGETAVMLGVRPGTGLRIALEDPMRADTLFLERTATDITDHVKLISAYEELDAELHITEAGVRHVLGLLRQRFNYVVVDLPVPLLPAVHPVIALSRHVLVLLEPEITGLRNARSLRTTVMAIAGKNRVFTVLNRFNREGGLPLVTVAEQLDVEPKMLLRIPDLKGMSAAINSGQAAIYRVSKLRHHLGPIVQEITGLANGKSWLKRLLGR